MRAKDVRPGDTVIVRKAGDVIPEVVGPVLSMRPAGTEPWVFPTTCPCPLGSTLVRLEGEADTRCVEPACPFQRDQRVIYFASRGAMDIEGLGERTVGQLTASGLVADAADLYALTQEQLLTLEGFATISADKLLAAIDGSRQRPLPRLLTALGIKHLGPAASQALAAHFGTLDAVMAASPESLGTVEGLGPIIANAITMWFSLEPNRAFVERLRAAGVDFGVAHRAGPEQLPQIARRQGRRRQRDAGRLHPRGGRGGDRRPRRQEPGQREREDLRPRRRRQPRRQQGHQGREGRRADPRRGRLRAAPGDRRRCQGRRCEARPVTLGSTAQIDLERPGVASGRAPRPRPCASR